MKIYINGKLAASKPKNGEINQTNNVLAIGQKVAEDNNWLIGNVDHVMLWDYARTQSEIQNDMINSPQPKTKGLLGLWEANEGQGLDALDSSGNNKNGKLYYVEYTNGVDVSNTKVVLTGFSDIVI